MRPVSHPSALFAAAAGAVLLAGPAYAQAPAGSGEPTAVEEVIVTAQKREERLQDVPLAITALSSEAIERSGALSLRDIVALAPSVTFSQSQGPVQSNIAIRGVGSSGGVAGLEPSVGVYVDGVYLDRTSIAVADFNDIERIEVLRGPQGTLFGKNTPAGTISFITKRPSFERGGDVSLTAGNYGARYASGAFTGPLSDELAVRVSAFWRERDGFLRNEFDGSDVNDLKAYGVRARALWRPSDSLEILASYENHRTRQNCCAPEFSPLGATQRAVASALGKPFPVQVDPEDLDVFFDGGFSYKHVINAYALEANYQVAGHTLTSITSVRDYDQRSFIDADFSQLDFFRLLSGNRDHKQVSQELRIASPADQRLTYVAGLFYFQKEQKERGQGIYGADTSRIFARLGGALAQLAPLYTTIRTSQSGSDIDNHSYAAFGQASYALTDTFDVTVGLRYTYDDKSIYTFQVTTEPVPILAPPRSERASDSDGQWSGVINVRYRPDRDTTWYASVTRGYKAFGFNDSAVNTTIGQRRFFDAELSTGFEAGWKKVLPAQAANLSLVGFWTDFDDYQASSFAPGNTFLLQNAGKLTTRGFEFEGAWRPVSGLDLTGAYTYLDAEYDEFLTGPGLEGVSQVQDLSNRPLQDAPKHAFSLTAQYTFPLSVAGLNAFVRGEASYRSRYQTAQNLDPLLVQDAYALFNARAGVTADRWSLEIWGRNLSDELILYRGGTPPAVFTAGSRIRFLSDPRTYGVTLRADF